MTTQWGHNTHTIQAYEPPTWAKHLHYIPKSRVQVSHSVSQCTTGTKYAKVLDY